LTHIKTAKILSVTSRAVLIIYTALDVTEKNIAVLYVSITYGPYAL